MWHRARTLFVFPLAQIKYVSGQLLAQCLVRVEETDLVDLIRASINVLQESDAQRGPKGTPRSGCLLPYSHSSEGLSEKPI